jgi:hypothetical protein
MGDAASTADGVRFALGNNEEALIVTHNMNEGSMNRVIWGEIPPSAYVSLVQRYCRKRSWRERYVRQVPGGWGYLSRGMAI